ncbi:beta-ketoacyl-[acyl-carrier-protein] synthase family protein [Streptomyces sp. MUM 203J]|uniref:beta-ketoacyl-[acyl-carrier-protein] synthase family protein n=1 Tax=Streptomyces sp. MUM 203J TaxID=2791990 RepID=UPI001F04E30C|nr:beta-ketoacyl-[acyl-carrier-protein] synthase family protein [Streptomyces sp. MUM 203J]MCH0539689.1 beta-ketoacyl-[acyl-carrier-protein] synthase family protein [Streptomyces sp. MUM 203J]
MPSGPEGPGYGGGAAVTGVGAVTPLGVGAGVLYERSVAGARGIGEDGFGRCADFRADAHLSRQLMRRTDRFTQLALVAAAEALAQAGWRADAPPYPPHRIACVIGCGLGGTASFEAGSAVFAHEGAEHVSPLMVPQMMANAAASQLSILYGFEGEALCVASACSSGAQAVGAGLRLLAAGEADAVVVGGAEASTSDLVASAFGTAGALSPTGTSRPFDRDRDGFVIGEGAGVLVLERPEGAARRGAEVLGGVLGYGATADAHHITAPAPGAEAAGRAVTLALRRAGAAPRELAYINAHGTGTARGDRLECAALRAALGEGVLAGTPVSSSKGALGHLFGAAGAVEAIVTLLALRHGTAPPTVGLGVPDPGLGGVDLVRSGARAMRGGVVRLGLSTSFGFGGHNAALLLKGLG